MLPPLHSILRSLLFTVGKRKIIRESVTLAVLIPFFKVANGENRFLPKFLYICASMSFVENYVEDDELDVRPAFVRILDY
jgi:hypothetical protein